MEQITWRLFYHRVFSSLNAATLQAGNGLSAMQTNKETLKRLTNLNWINAILNADLNKLSERRAFLVVK